MYFVLFVVIKNPLTTKSTKVITKSTKEEVWNIPVNPIISY